MRGCPGCLAGKESACNAGDPISIPGSGRSPGERIGYPPQYSWASLMVQMVKNTPALLFCISFSGDGLDPCLLYNVTNLCP